ncbi:DUF397 domain-containing protein [Streptomyces sp. NPDC059611]|uniref:DUF397 domain-containing protein n=1 Tax=Streptomyces sp. NPDC059611 TaxID=3346884 RepID=UPI0036842756
MTPRTQNLYAAEIDPTTRHRSSYTANNGNCVELAQLPAIPDAIAVSDTWYPDRPGLRGSKNAFAQLTQATLTGKLTAV